MSKIKLVLTSSEVEGIFSNVNIVVNGNMVKQELQLSATPETVIIDTNLSDQNTLYFDLLNHTAIDLDGDGENDLTMYVTVQEMQVAEDDANFKQLVPQAAKYTTLKGVHPPYVDRQLLLEPPIDNIQCWTKDDIITFNKSIITKTPDRVFQYFSVQGNQIFENGKFSQKLTDQYYWGQ